jgi:hypothetical protein
MEDTTRSALLDALTGRAELPADYGAMAFWFWNDDLEEAGLLRQVRAFRDGGFGGVVIHPRVGLSARIGYLTPEYFRLVRRVVDECAALGLRVILYDEGSYPSGSACGLVVAENPAFAARALVLQKKDVSGPYRGYWRVADGRSLTSYPVCAAVGRVMGGAIDPESVQLLPIGERGLVRLDLGPGEWRAMACLDVPSGGTIRGALPEEDDRQATAPPAGDIMNPDAVAAFIRLTHDAYASTLKDHFGSTVLAMFTDEPSPMGRGARRGAMPYTGGFTERVAERLDWSVERTLAWLPALWEDYGPETEQFREAFVAAVEARIDAVFYRAQAEWCERHGLALTGHPHSSNDMRSLARFHWPGQDAVWRWVLPGETALSGEHSVSAKAATSAARASGRRRIATELFGAYGWQLSLDEAKWLIDWHLARGNNLFIPHACFYSVRDGRAFESEPDLALHNCWWPHFRHLLAYVRRMSWLLTDCEHVCDVAIAGVGHALPSAAAASLYQRQIDFLYVDEDALARARIRDGSLQVGTQRYRSVIVEEGTMLAPEAAARLRELRDAGGVVLTVPATAEAEALLQVLPADVRLDPPNPDLRMIHVRKDGADVYALFNEGEHTIEGALTLVTAGTWQVVDPLRGTVDRPQVGETVRLSLGCRESRLLVAVADGSTAEATGAAPDRRDEWDEVLIPVFGPWRVLNGAGQDVPDLGLGDWSAVPDLERFSGILRYVTAVALDAEARQRLERCTEVAIDLSEVGEAAEVSLNGVVAGRAMWAPYRVSTPAELWRTGEVTLEVAVTNSAANHYEGALRPSGLMGPVVLRLK